MPTTGLAYHTSHIRFRRTKKTKKIGRPGIARCQFCLFIRWPVAAAPGHIGKIRCSRTEARQARRSCANSLKTFAKLKKRSGEGCSSSTLIVVTHVFSSAPKVLPQRAPTYCGYMIRFTGSLYHKSKVDYQLPRTGCIGCIPEPYRENVIHRGNIYNTQGCRI